MKQGYFGDFGGRFVPAALEEVLAELTIGFEEALSDPTFLARLSDYLQNYVGRETPLYFASNLTAKANGAKIYLKREDLAHMGSHKINNCLGQGLLAKRMNKKQVIAETGAGQHGVATATACALLGLNCKIFMGKEDMARQQLNVYRIQLLGAEVIPVSSGTQTLKDAVDEALTYYVAHAQDTYYMLGSAVGPHPFPQMVKTFQSVIGQEARAQILASEGKLPDYLVACVGGGSNAIGLFAPFYEDATVKMIGVEPAGKGLHTPFHAASLTLGTEGTLHGFRCYLLQDKEGLPLPVHSIAAGLDYPGVGPEHCFYKESGRAQYESVTDEEALIGFALLSRHEGIIPAIESAHALYYGFELAKNCRPDEVIIINLSGRGDKDVARMFEMQK